jgi:hypothetical protein
MRAVAILGAADLARQDIRSVNAARVGGAHAKSQAFGRGRKTTATGRVRANLSADPTHAVEIVAAPAWALAPRQEVRFTARLGLVGLRLATPRQENGKDQKPCPT